jgi:hypothetical protein
MGRCKARMQFAACGIAVYAAMIMIQSAANTNFGGERQTCRGKAKLGSS